MNSYIGEIIKVEGRGEICSTKISKELPLPHKGDSVLINGEIRIVKDVDVSLIGELGRKEEVGIVLFDKGYELKSVV